VSSATAPSAPEVATRQASGADLIRFLPFAAAAVTLLVSVLTIGRAPLWLDEAFTIGATNQLADSFWQRSGSMFLYYVVIGPFVDVSIDPTWLRMPSTVFAAGSVLVTVDLARRFLTPAAAVWTAAFLIPMWAVVRYAQEVRSYALVMLLATLAWWLLFRLAERESRSLWITLGMVWVALVHSHPLAGLLVVAQLASLRLAPRDPDSPSLLRSSLPAWATAGALMVPMVLSLVRQDDGVAPDWVPPLGRWTVSSVLEMVAGPWGIGQAVAVVALVASSLLVVMSHEDEPMAWRENALLLWLWAPLATLAVVSIAEPMLAGRFVILSIPATALVLARAVSGFGKHRLSLLAGTLMVVSLLPGQVMLHRDHGHPWDDAVEVVAADPTLGVARHGVIFLDDSSRNAFEVNAMGTPVVDATVPVAPAEPWGTHLRYYAEVELSMLVPTLESLDVLWLVEQFQVGGGESPWHWGVSEPFESLGFCRDATHRFEHDIEVVRFVACR
jgi:mannosyltransferase